MNRWGFRPTEGMLGACLASVSVFTGMLFNVLVLFYGLLEKPISDDDLEHLVGKDQITIKHHRDDRKNYIQDAVCSIYACVLVSALVDLGILACFLLPSKEQVPIWWPQAQFNVPYGLTMCFSCFFISLVWRVLYNFMMLFDYESRLRSA